MRVHLIVMNADFDKRPDKFAKIAAIVKNNADVSKISRVPGTDNMIYIETRMNAKRDVLNFADNVLESIRDLRFDIRIIGVK